MLYKVIIDYNLLYYNTKVNKLYTFSVILTRSNKISDIGEFYSMMQPSDNGLQVITQIITYKVYLRLFGIIFILL